MIFYFFASLFTWAALATTKPQPLRVYTYDSLAGRSTLGEYLSQRFLQQTGVEIQFVSFGTAGEALNQVFLEGTQTTADVLLGIDEVLYQKVKDKGLFERLGDDTFASLEPSLRQKGDSTFVPFDYGFLAFLYDSERTRVTNSIQLKDFVKGFEKSKKVVIQDPRTSTLGVEFLVWTHEKLGDGFEQFWRSLAPQILTISPGWSGAYELFIKKQADFVLSYTTSPAYHRIKENKHNIKPVFFTDGHFRQVEGALILNRSKQKKLGEQFVKLLLSKEAQEQVATFQWMYPARAEVRLPKEFKEIPIPKKVVVDWNRVAALKENWLKKWTLMMSQVQK
jgi:thiamine transport system substrate-binding protein